ncbi:hypothetical protein B0H17DRAFT_1106757 [Mycena rosella]|uniref:Fungal-type protein kinase domain-containing protein n=1 Tax=Mycena rosella TaxID=1033263 RepID=A0AAD7FTS4_MYCRO|nr:hypothetical protein B0H17DRAFT_1106757 [Mycena rosella]
MLSDDFAGVITIANFLESMPMSERRRTIPDIVAASATLLEAASEALGKAEKEDDMAETLINYLKEVVSNFPDGNKPLIADTHTRLFAALDKGGHYTKPDITASRPGMGQPQKWDWPCAGTVIELKYRTDIFDGDNIKETKESQDALIQLAKSARSFHARLFRFDRSGFKVSTAFDWKTDDTVFPTFLWRLYNPTRRNRTDPIRMYGEDDTFHYSFSDATVHSLWVQAVRFSTDDAVPPKRASNPVRCFTIGIPLATSDGLFSRATLVYRVIVEDDADSDNPVVYALKDAWRQACRRPEVDFYDVIARYCKDNNVVDDEMAKCHGSLDLSVEAPGYDHDLHKTHSTASNRDELERHHMRSLLTPVGVPLNTFQSTKDFARALQTAIIHHKIAHDAGVLHRDVSEGNILFQEIGTTSKAFLVDWDYAQFTQIGLENFNRWFGDRKAANEGYETIEKSLKDLTVWDLSFLGHRINERPYGGHAIWHDLESFYWLFIWCILRYTPHTHADRALACAHLFDTRKPGPKSGWLQDPSPIDVELPFHQLAEGLRWAVVGQNPTRAGLSKKYAILASPVSLTYERLLAVFTDELSQPGWPEDDIALPFYAPSLDEATETKKGKTQSQSLQQFAIKQQHELRKRPLDRDEGTALPLLQAAPIPRSRPQKGARQRRAYQYRLLRRYRLGAKR